jgi:hypothetical protein
MIAIVLIALAAGCASAFMFASIASGALISLLLIYLAPLPLMMVAIGWGPLGATIGGIAAASGLGLLFGLPYCIGYALAIALPAWWLGHLVLLGRPGTHNQSAGNDVPQIASDLEWYSVGRILLWIAGFAVLTTIASLLTLGSDSAAIAATIKRGLLRMFGPGDVTALSPDTARLFDALVTIAPAAAAIGAMINLTINLWLATWITAKSGRLHRPWPDLKSTALPAMALVVLCVAAAFCFTGGLFAIVAQVVAAALLMAYALTGFAVLHTLTLALKNRVLWLSCTYVIVMVFSWPILMIVALGLADALFGFRERFMRTRPPPLPVV